ncbi:hypothetical protein AAG565_09235 [Fontimonas sp. SYSU GA230001]|uniref:hypothetical protein n=1 Tax=Fontimonas sp. SYSU GA230001 TaxID=3142450 RepID=UPI0032B3CD24
MSAKGLTMSVVAVAVAAGTYFGLEAAFPPAASKNARDSNGAAVDRVFKGTLDTSRLSGAEAAQAVVEQEAGTADAGAGTETADSGGYAEESDGSAVDTAPAPAASTSADDSAYAPEPEPAPTPLPTPRPEPVTPAAKPAPAKPDGAGAAAPAPKLAQWWGPEADDRLSIVYAGSAAYTRAIVLMLNGAFDDTASIEQNVRVTDAAGKTVAGKWQIGANNKRMLLLPVDKPGIYTVSVKADLADRSGRKLGKAQKGPVRVQ